LSLRLTCPDAIGISPLLQIKALPHPQRAALRKIKLKSICKINCWSGDEQIFTPGAFFFYKLLCSIYNTEYRGELGIG